MNSKSKAILIGTILGDAYLQKTGEKNARIRLEHSEKQKEYLSWLGENLKPFFQGKPTKMTRFNPIFKKTYSTVRWQSSASPEIGKWRRIFYVNGKKCIPKVLPEIFKDNLSLAVWFMDDGYYYKRDKIAYIYLPELNQTEKDILLLTLKNNFNLEGIIKIKKRGENVLIFKVFETEKLMKLISSHIIPSMSYKISA